jgi:hypothetical protein
MNTLTSISNTRVQLTVHWSQPAAIVISGFTIAKLASSYLEQGPTLSLVNISLLALTTVSCGYAIKASKVFAQTITKNSEVSMFNKQEYEEALALQKECDSAFSYKVLQNRR